MVLYINVLLIASELKQGCAILIKWSLKKHCLYDCKFSFHSDTTLNIKRGKNFTPICQKILWVISLNPEIFDLVSHCPWRLHFSTHINLSFFADRGSSWQKKKCCLFYHCPLISTLFSNMCEKHTANIANEMRLVNAFMGFTND